MTVIQRYIVHKPVVSYIFSNYFSLDTEHSYQNIFKMIDVMLYNKEALALIIHYISAIVVTS